MDRRNRLIVEVLRPPPLPLNSINKLIRPRNSAHVGPFSSMLMSKSCSRAWVRKAHKWVEVGRQPQKIPSHEGSQHEGENQQSLNAYRLLGRGFHHRSVLQDSHDFQVIDAEWGGKRICDYHLANWHTLNFIQAFIFCALHMKFTITEQPSRHSRWIA